MKEEKEEKEQKKDEEIEEAKELFKEGLSKLFEATKKASKEVARSFHEGYFEEGDKKK
jgi:hypothetical protein